MDWATCSWLFWEQKAGLYSLHFYVLAYDEQTGKEVEVGSAGHGPLANSSSLPGGCTQLTWFILTWRAALDEMNTPISTLEGKGQTLVVKHLDQGSCTTMAKAATQAEGTASTRDVVDPASIENVPKMQRMFCLTKLKPKGLMLMPKAWALQRKQGSSSSML